MACRLWAGAWRKLHNAAATTRWRTKPAWRHSLSTTAISFFGR